MRKNRVNWIKAVWLLLAALAFSIATAGAWAQSSNVEWTRLGTLPPGTRNIAAGDVNGLIVYALNAEGISRSSDGGATWEICGRDARYMRLVAPSGQGGNPVLYAAGNAGLRQSDDGCRTWRDVPTQGVMPSGGHIRWLAPYPNNSQILYAGMDGLGGLYRSTDRGATWQPASTGLPAGAWVTALAADPRRPERIFVGLRYPSEDHPPAYIYRSSDGGLTWRSASLGMRLLPNNSGQVNSLAWSGDALFASTASDGLYASNDRGDSWQAANLPRRTEGTAQAMPPGPDAQPLPMPIGSLISNPEGALLISTAEGEFESLDGTRTWRNFGPDGSRGSASLVAMDAAGGRVLLAGAKGMWGYQMPSGVVSLPTATAPAVAQVPPTPPPPVDMPTFTPVPPTTTRVPPTPTIAIAKGPLPTDRAEPLDPAVSDYFPQTGHNIAHGFRDYWANDGGLGLFGYPLTEELVENGVTVQYFERTRLEYRDGEISMGLLGTELTKGHFYQTVRFFPSEDNNVYFGPTQHSMSGPFLTFWRERGGLSTLGFPLSQSFKDDGSEYQWFERARLEYHPDLPEGKRIVLGNIGTEALRKRGWIR